MNGSQFVDKTANERISKKELEKLAEVGNIYAMYQQSVDRTGLGVNFQALLPKDACRHLINYGNGYIERRIAIETTRSEGFVFKELICTLCGKTLGMKVYKPKSPRRLQR